MSLESRLRHVEDHAAREAASNEAPTEAELDQMLRIVVDDEEAPPGYKIPLSWVRSLLTPEDAGNAPEWQPGSRAVRG